MGFEIKLQPNQMMRQKHQKSPSQFTFKSNGSKQQFNNMEENISKDNLYDERFLFSLGTLEQQFEDYHKNIQIEEMTSTKRTFAPIKKEQLEQTFKYFQKYQPLYFNKDIIKELSNKYKKGVYIKKYKEGFYFGEVIEQINENQPSKKIKHGKGVFVYNLFDKKNEQNKRIFQGQWLNDKKNGLGFQRFTDGSVYHGNYKDNKPQGRGKFTDKQGQIYQGQWRDGSKQGKGFWHGTNGQTYMGEWKYGKPNGYGVFMNKIGNKYEGQFLNGLKHGQGVEKFINGDIYKGHFENDQPHGYGEYYWKNKSYFKGYFSNGLRQGQGFWKKCTGNSDQYQGQYKRDKKWGYGIFTWANGNVFKGNYQADNRNGYGQMYWKNGSYYKGQWKDGIQNGKGELFIIKEGLRVGIFENNEIVTIQYQEPIHLKNQENKIIKIKHQYKQLLHNPSKMSKSASKNSPNFRTKTQKNLSNQKPSSQSTYQKPYQKPLQLSKTIPQKIERRKYLSESQNGMRSIPLKSLPNRNDSFSYIFNSINLKREIGFRMTQKQNIIQKINESINNQSRIHQFQEPHKRKNRILHSSFYLHKFRKIKSQENNGQQIME